jgi:hypothetical protein
MIMANRRLLAIAPLAALASAQWTPEEMPVSMPTGPYELETYDPVAAPAQVVSSGNVRFTVLAERFIRMEHSATGKFEEKATLGFLNRNIKPVPAFTTKKAGTHVTIETAYLTLAYTGDGKAPLSTSNLLVTGKGKSGFKSWAPGLANDGNLLGTIKSLDTIGPTSLNCTEVPVATSPPPPRPRPCRPLQLGGGGTAILSHLEIHDGRIPV